MKQFFYILVFLFLGMSTTVFSQEDNINSREFSVKVEVIDEKTNEPIVDAKVSVNGYYFSFSTFHRKYIIKAKPGNELVVRHPDFETVYYTVKDDEDIKVLVKDFPRQRRSKFNSKSKKVDHYQQYLDSSKFYKTKNIDKSLSFIENAIKNSNSKERKASSYATLGDIYSYWKQYDLAIENYNASLTEISNNDVRLELAKAEFLHKDYKASELSFTKSLKNRLSKYQKITAYEGLGDVFFATKFYKKAKIQYNSALQIAKTNSVTSKITDLNSKIADVFSAEGNVQKANTYFNNSLNLAKKENPSRALKEQGKVADFYNKSNRFDDEIKLRKETLKKKEKENLPQDKISEPDAITSQKINYKIGNAYIQKEAYKEAIPFLKKSIKDAEDKKDLIVEKDATRKLSEVYESVGEFTKALKSYQDYVKLVDKLYIKKEQEIQQAKRFSRKIADNQSRIVSLEKDKALTDSKINLAYKDQQLTQESNKRQQLIIYSLIAGMLLLGLLAYFMFRTNKQQKLANNLLSLKSMRSQMNPHFIFNALNSVNSFIAVNDERSANRYLSEFSVLMRSVLENSDEDFIPLTKEIELLELYVKLEHNRFQDKFDYTISIDKNINLEKYSIPPMLLQPYIENAIWHGLRYKKEKGNLTISMKQSTDDSLLISIEDNGVGRTKSKEMKTKNQLKQKSKGMSTIKNRIAILNDMYQDKISVQVSDVLEDGCGTKVELILKKD